MFEFCKLSNVSNRKLKSIIIARTEKVNNQHLKEIKSNSQNPKISIKPQNIKTKPNTSKQNISITLETWINWNESKTFRRWYLWLNFPRKVWALSSGEDEKENVLRLTKTKGKQTVLVGAVANWNIISVGFCPFRRLIDYCHDSSEIGFLTDEIWTVDFTYSLCLTWWRRNCCLLLA